MDRRTILRGVAAGVATTAALASESSASARAGTVTIFAVRSKLTLPNVPVPGLTFSARLNLFADKALTTPIGIGSGSATVIDVDLTDIVGGLVTPFVHAALVLTRDGDPPAGVTLSALFKRRNSYPRTYLAMALGGYGAWTPSADLSTPSAEITAHGGGEGPSSYLKIVLRTAA